MVQTRPCHVLYGSVTGNAEEIARIISEDAPSHGVQAQLACLEQFKKANLEPGSVCVFVVSTTGEGEAPENANRFMRTIKRKTQPADMFAGITFAVCGLGDTNYANFCNTGKILNRRMKELGAESFYDMCEADEGVGGLEQFIEPWKAGLWAPLRVAVGIDAGAEAAPAEPEPEPAEPEPEPQLQPPQPQPEPATRLQLQPCDAVDGPLAAERARQAVGRHVGAELFGARPSGARQLTAPDAVKTVWHLQLDAAWAEGTAPPQPGDALGVLVPNDAEEVSALCTRLGWDAHAAGTVSLGDGDAAGGSGLPSHLPSEAVTIGALLTHCTELRTVSRKSLLKALSACCGDAAEAEALARLTTKQGKADYATVVLEEGLTLLELLGRYPSCAPPLGLLLELLPPLMPRYYSLSTTPLAAAGASSLGFAFTVVEWTTPAGVARQGLATTQLAALASSVAADASSGSAALCCFLKPTPSFRLPEAPETPCILIGPGTGVAPFVGFAQHRLAQAEAEGAGWPAAARGKLTLYFGCRHEAKDFLYREELEAAVGGGALGRLVTAFSRETAEKVYVQHRLAEDGAAVAAALLSDEGPAPSRVYVCGDGGAMFKAVHVRRLPAPPCASGARCP